MFQAKAEEEAETLRLELEEERRKTRFAVSNPCISTEKGGSSIFPQTAKLQKLQQERHQPLLD